MSARRACLWLILIAAAPAGAELPPLDLAATLNPAMPAGETVSQPLTDCIPVAAPPLPIADDPHLREVTLTRFESQPRPFGVTWTKLEYLIWYPKGQPVPPLVTASRGIPVLGSPATAVLIGGSQEESQAVSGGRFTKGFALNSAGTAAVAVSYFFLGTRTDRVTVAAPDARGRNLGRPFVDAADFRPGVLPLAGPGFVGSATLLTNVRVTGWEINGLGNLINAPMTRVHALAGYRYFQTAEGLRLEQHVFDANGLSAGVADQFDTRNAFHGGQLGLIAECDFGRLDLELTGKIALGRSNSTLRVSGGTVARNADGSVDAFGAGVLALASNSGSASEGHFAVLPEAGVKLGYRFGDRARVFLGYNFIYLSDAARPGDQIDPVLDVTQVPLNGRFVAAGDRPGPLFARSDFWVQGMMLGLEYRY